MDEAGGLRERKKARTRSDIVAATVDLCVREGYGTTTVAMIAERAAVSERTFFRFFATKQDAVTGLEAELFDHAIDELGTGGGRTATEALGLAIATATTRFDDVWWTRFACAARIIDDVDAVEAAALRFCARTGERFRENLRPADPTIDEHVVELAVQSAVSAWRLARRDWLRDGAPDPAALRILLNRYVEALGPAVALVVA